MSDANIIPADELATRRAMRDAKNETSPPAKKYFSIVEYARQMWPNEEATKKVAAHYAGRLLRWQLSLREDVGIDDEIELLDAALKRALFHKEEINA